MANPIRSAVVTGGAGFLGRHLVRRLLSQNIKVLVLDNFSCGDREPLAILAKQDRNLRVIEHDVCQPWTEWPRQISETEFRDLSHVFHLASPASPKFYQKLNLETLRANAIGTDRALEFATERGLRLIFASSSEIYGSSAKVPFCEDDWGHVNPLGARSCYVEAKRFAEAMVFHFNSRYSTQHGIVRIFNAYGPGMRVDDGRVMINFLTQLLSGDPLTVFGSGQQTRSFCYVDDMIDALMLYAEREICRPVNLGGDTEVTILELIEVMAKVVGRPVLNMRFLSAPEDDPLRRRPDLSLARHLLSPWEPKVDLETGLRRTWAWLSGKPIVARNAAGAAEMALQKPYF